MKVFLDTNIFYNDWFMNNANFKYLFHFLNNEGHELILSELVVQEVENIRRREVASCLAEIKKQTRKIQKLNQNKIAYKESELGVEEYELLPIIKSRVESVEVFDYKNISHVDVVERALTNKKPFLEGEKGYRDTLIWLSFLNHISDIKDNVIFITENKSDFFKTKDRTISFHDDLQTDIKDKGVEAKIEIYTSLFDFVNSTIDKDDHAIDKINAEELFEDFLEESGSRFIENMSHKDLSYHYEASIFDSKVKDILDIRTDVWEGIEDLELINTTKLDGNDIYVSCRYNLRRVTVEIDIPESDYIENKDELHRLFIDIDISSNTAILSSYVRPYFDVSFIYNDRDDSFKDYEVADLYLRQ
ncbi:TPA: PIN domain-containing protein [Aeromonas hydrophila]